MSKTVEGPIIVIGSLILLTLACHVGAWLLGKMKNKKLASRLGTGASGIIFGAIGIFCLNGPNERAYTRGGASSSVAIGLILLGVAGLCFWWAFRKKDRQLR